jgi:Fe-S oxidoreductase
MRMADVIETKAEIVAVACPGCSAMLEGVVEPRPEVKDIAELMVDALIKNTGEGVVESMVGDGV